MGDYSFKYQEKNVSCSTHFWSTYMLSTETSFKTPIHPSLFSLPTISDKEFFVYNNSKNHSSCLKQQEGFKWSLSLLHHFLLTFHVM